MMLNDPDYLPKLACLCCTYLRPNLLEHAIESFRRQDYPKDRCELIVLDDAGQYTSISQENWQVVSVPRRFRTLGEKRNACAGMSSKDVDAYAIWDDDDIYLPHTLRAHAHALSTAQWSRPSTFLHEHVDGRLEARPTRGLFHAAWALARTVFDQHYGYPAMNTGEDANLMNRMLKSGITQADPCEYYPPYFIHRWETSGCWHISAMGSTGYEILEAKKSWHKKCHLLKPSWPKDYVAQARSSFVDQPVSKAGRSIPKVRASAVVTVEQVKDRRQVCVACSQAICIKEDKVHCRASDPLPVNLKTGRCKLRKWAFSESFRPNQIIQCFVFEGLSNRINAIASALATGKEVKLRWAVNRHCPVRFDEVFRDIPNIEVVSENVEAYPYVVNPDRICWYYPRNVMNLKKDNFRQRVYRAYRLLLDHMMHSAIQTPPSPALGLHFRYHHKSAGDIVIFTRSMLQAVSRLRPRGIYIATDSEEHRIQLVEALASSNARLSWSSGAQLVQDLQRSKEHIASFIEDLRALSSCQMGIITNSTCSSATDVLRGLGIKAYATHDDGRLRYGGNDDLFQRRMVNELIAE